MNCTSLHPTSRTTNHAIDGLPYILWMKSDWLCFSIVACVCRDGDGGTFWIERSCCYLIIRDFCSVRIKPWISEWYLRQDRQSQCETGLTMWGGAEPLNLHCDVILLGFLSISGACTLNSVSHHLCHSLTHFLSCNEWMVSRFAYCIWSCSPALPTFAPSCIWSCFSNLCAFL